MHKQLEGCKALCQHGILKAFCERLFRDLLVGFFFSINILCVTITNSKHSSYLKLCVEFMNLTTLLLKLTVFYDHF